MKLYKQHGRTGHLDCCANQHGAVLVFVAFLLIVLLGITALAVDIGYVAITRNQLQNAADAAALAGAGKLGMIYEPQDPPLSLNSSQEGDVKDVALYVGLENKVAGQSPNIIKSSDIIVGYWDSKVNTFYDVPPSVPIPRIPNAVRVTTRPSGGGPIPLGSVTTFFANIFGIANVAVSATATASLTSPCDLNPGGPSPFAISKDSPYCSTDPTIIFTGGPSTYPCGGWQTFETGVNATSIRNMLNTMLSQNGCFSKGYPECGSNPTTNFFFPVQEVGDTANVINGLTGNWECIQNLYMCVRDGIKWEVLVPVVLGPCGNIQQNGTIDSFATVTISGVTIGEGANIKVEGDACGNSPCIKASVVCDNVISEKGEGCAFHGTYGSIPGLVDKHKL
jgi:hypothetical protein